MELKRSGQPEWEKQLNLPEANLPVEYSIPFDWGNLYVTEAAHKAYGMVPLSPETVDGKPPTSTNSAATPRVDVILVGPEEYEHDDQSALVATKIYSGGVGMVIGFPAAQDEISKHLGASLGEKLAKMEEELPTEVMEEIKEHSIIPTAEDIENDLPQMLAHQLAGVAEVPLAEGLETWFGKQGIDREYRKIVALGIGAIVAAGVEVTPGLASHNHLVNPIQIAFAGVLALVYLNLARTKLKTHIENGPLNQRIAKLTARNKAFMISYDLHNSFCRNHFDRNAETMLNGDDPTDSEDF